MKPRAFQEIRGGASPLPPTTSELLARIEHEWERLIRLASDRAREAVAAPPPRPGLRVR